MNLKVLLIVAHNIRCFAVKMVFLYRMESLSLLQNMVMRLFLYHMSLFELCEVESYYHFLVSIAVLLYIGKRFSHVKEC